MSVGTGVALADLTTLRLGGPARRLVTVATEAELVDAVRGADADGVPLLVLGGGSNLVVGDDGFDGLVVKVATRGIGLTEESFCSGVDVTVAAGEDWDELVAHTVDHGWSGLEALSGIPGLTGATPIQNVGAYGADVSQTISTVRTWDRHHARIRTFFSVDCAFGYRTSVFKAQPDRYVVLDVTFQLPLGDYSAPIRYAELARALDVPLGTKVPADDLRAAVLALRAGKGMVLDAADHDTWSAGSFFTNPVLAADAVVPVGAPRYAQPDGRGKTSAAWLIEHAGFGRGYGRGPVTVSTKHTLALTNRGGAQTADLLTLAREVRDGVRQAYGITLEPEPVLLGCTL
ncbi:MAG: UDP-N-acetylmuramate dehydrogenase [Propionibacteriaceae bacterium]